MAWNTALVAQAESAGGQLQNFLELFTTPTGFVGLGVIVALAALSLAVPRLRWALLGLMLFASTLSFPPQTYFRPVLMFPLEQMRYQGRGLTMGLMLALALPAIAAVRGWRTQLVLGAAWSYFAFELLYSMRLGLAGETARGIFGVIIYVLTFGVIGLGVARWLQGVPDVHRLMRGIVVGAGCFVLVTTMQLLRDRSQVLWANRLYGVTGNPQHFALSAALFLGPVCYVVVRRGEPLLWRLFGGAVAGPLVIFLVWTGSRTGALMAAVEFLLLFRLRLGRMLALTVVGGIFLLIGLQFFSEGFETAERLVSTQDTRSGVWQRMIDSFLRNPLTGTLGEDFGVAESSYLAVASLMGLLGIIPLAVTMALTAYAMYRLHRLRRELADEILLVDLTTAGIGCIAAGAMFEGYLLGTISIAVFFIYLYLAVIAFLIDLGQSRRDGAQLDWEEDHRRQAELAYEATY